MEKTSTGFKVSIFRVMLLLSALIILSILSALSLNISELYTVLISFSFVIVFSIGILLVAFLLSLPNGTIRKNHRFSAITHAVINGFAFLFPFAVLALISDLIFHWNAIQAITCASIFTCVSVATSDMIQLGGKKTANYVFSFLASVIFILLYMGIIIGTNIILIQI